MEILMNSMPEMAPAILQTPGAAPGFQDKSSPDKSVFASLVEKECSKSADCKSNRNEINSESATREDDGSNDDRSACNDCTNDIKNTTHNTSGANEQRETDSEPVKKDDDHADDEADSGKGLKTGALLFSLMNDYIAEIGKASQASTGEGTSETAGIGSSGPGSKTAAENGLKVGTLLSNMISGYAAEFEEASDINYENEANAELAGAESGEAVPDSHGDNGSKIGELLNRPADRSDEKKINMDLISEEMASNEKTIEINTEADGSEADSLIFGKEISAEAKTKNEISGHMDNIHADDKTAVMEMPETNDNSEGLTGRPMSGSSDQLSHDNGSGDHAFNFTKGPHNSGNDAETNNINSINTSNTTYDNAKSVQSPSGLHTAKTPGVQELLDKVVYVIKGNSKMGVSVEHEGLGKLNISLSLEKGLVNVHINTSDQAVREIIENNVQQIIDTLNKDGVSVGEFSVALRDQKEHEINRPSLKNGQGGEISQETNKQDRHSGLVNIFA